jgi:sulfate adenylyltransferase subunit 1 (EFTu-like GTPase family)
METLVRDEERSELRTNDISRVELQLAGPIYVDAYRKNKATGSFILIDEQSNQTLAVGMIS